jgi:hypothetical protein
LSLFVARIAAHDADHAPAANDLALIANTPDAGTDFHGKALTRQNDSQPADDSLAGHGPELAEND